MNNPNPQPRMSIQHNPDPSLLEAYQYISSVPGKDVRGKLIDCFQLWFVVESPDILKAIKVKFSVTLTIVLYTPDFCALVCDLFGIGFRLFLNFTIMLYGFVL